MLVLLLLLMLSLPLLVLLLLLPLASPLLLLRFLSPRLAIAVAAAVSPEEDEAPLQLTPAPPEEVAAGPLQLTVQCPVEALAEKATCASLRHLSGRAAGPPIHVYLVVPTTSPIQPTSPNHLCRASIAKKNRVSDVECPVEAPAATRGPGSLRVRPY